MAPIKLGRLGSNSSTWEVQAGGLDAQNHPELQRDGLYYVAHVGLELVTPLPMPPKW